MKTALVTILVVIVGVLALWAVVERPWVSPETRVERCATRYEREARRDQWQPLPAGDAISASSLDCSKRERSGKLTWNGEHRSSPWWPTP